MGGEINWAALPLLVEMLGVEDIDVFVDELAAIREHAAKMAKYDK